MTKINFSIRETSGRTFELDLEDLQKCYSELGEDIPSDNSRESICMMISEVLGDDLSNLDQFEKANDYFEWNITHIN